MSFDCNERSLDVFSKPHLLSFITIDISWKSFWRLFDVLWYCFTHLIIIWVFKKMFILLLLCIFFLHYKFLCILIDTIYFTEQDKKLFYAISQASLCDVNCFEIPSMKIFLWNSWIGDKNVLTKLFYLYLITSAMALW